MMNVRIEVASHKEGEQLRAGLADPAVRAFVKVCGVLAALPTTRARERVLRFVWESFEDQHDDRPPS